MTRLLTILLLASFVAGLAKAGEPELHGAGSQAVMLSQASGDPDGPMTAMDCGVCAAMGACISSGPAPCAEPSISRLPLGQPSPQLSDQACAPDTAPPKRSSI